MDNITTSVYHSRLNGQVERLVETFKRALRKNQGMDTDEKSIPKFLTINRITPNLNTHSGLSPGDLKFARKIWSVFNRLLPHPMKKVVNKKTLRQNFTDQVTGFSSEIIEVKKASAKIELSLKDLAERYTSSKEDSNVRNI